MLLYRVLKSYLLRKKIVDLVFYLQDQQGEPLRHFSVALADRRGKQVLQREGKPFVVQSDEEGQVVFDHLPGSLYTVLLGTEKKTSIAQFKAGLTKLKQTDPQVYLPKKTILSKKDDSNQLIIQIQQTNTTS
ncbi:hypothetical protein [Enterococcus dongliensis]|uniref:hypothetical protein n=1 Tax=Enterococcus dongliensis TaxID=2559925 RepID=UPI0028928FF8|nr:hypothetical protein [Enterococcus dongliensis]MDT2612925.1 hypothetical protein [Enterococcus dongliensis]